MIDYRVLHHPPELESVVDLEIAVWGVHPRDAVPANLLHVLALRGGLVLGAYDNTLLVGLLLALPVKHERDWILWSHMTGVHHAYRSQGIGVELKRLQRRWALDEGYKIIGWTFDPAPQRGNAHFNLHLLGAEAALTSTTYHVNFYGEMNDDINRGMPSDRVEALWRIDQPSLHTPHHAHVPALIHRGGNQEPIMAQSILWDAPAYRIAVPGDLHALRADSPDRLMEWRLALRHVLSSAFDHGYAAVDFTCHNGDCAYLVRRLTP